MTQHPTYPMSRHSSPYIKPLHCLFFSVSMLYRVSCQAAVHVLSWTVTCCVYLLCIFLSERQLGGDMEHNLLLSVDGVDGLRPRLTMGHI